MLAVGDLAPEFSATDQHGDSVTLSALLERGRLVLYFYPQDFTSVCTAQACIFRDASDALGELGVHLAGVSGDSIDSHRRFGEKHRVAFTLISDPELRISKAYDAKWPLLRRSARVTYVIDTDRRVLGAFRHELSAAKHLAEVRRVLENARGAP